MSCYRGLSREGKRALVFGATPGYFFGFAAVALFGPTAKRLQEVMQLGPLRVAILVPTLVRVPASASSDGVKVKP